MSVSNIGPGALLQDAGSNNGSTYLLSAAEWLTIQTYVNDALSLPTTDAAFKTSLGSGAPSDLTDFEPLITCYANIYAHCSTWKGTVFPATVGLSNDVFDYAQKAPIYYKAINTEANILTNDPTNTDALAALKAILANLTTDATNYQTRANTVAQQVTDFATQSGADKTVLLGSDGTGTKDGLVKKYTDEYGSESATVKELVSELAGLAKLLKTDTDEYNHDVIVASTTPTYAWIWPVGTIAAAIVAGIYGKRATDALDRMNTEQDKIKTLTAQEQVATNLIANLNIANSGMTKISTELTAALPIIQKVQGIWGAIASDLTNVSKIIDQDIAKALPVIMNFGVTEAIQAWQTVGTAADNYRVNAYIDVQNNAAQ